MVHDGIHKKRLTDGSMEQSFVDVWQRKNEDETFLTGVLNENITERDGVIAATIIQWLGTDVGQEFLNSVTVDYLEK